MTDTPVKKERPLSPHLQIYKLGITGYSSILHRMSGIALMLGLFLITWGLLALANGRESFELFLGFCQSTIGQLMLFGWTAAFFYHLSTGIRHFILDAGFLFEKQTASRAGWVVILIAAILTFATWGYIYKDVLMGGGAS